MLLKLDAVVLFSNIIIFIPRCINPKQCSRTTLDQQEQERFFLLFFSTSECCLKLFHSNPKLFITL